MNEEIATLGGGCFWCLEAVFKELRGVTGVQSGYAGGHVVNPSYKQVCSATTGHAEVTQVRFDPAQLDYADLLRVFFTTHDPTTKDRQGNDVGTSYRSAIFFVDDNQKEIALQLIAELNAAKIYRNPIVTEVVAAGPFWVAEDYHQDYYRLHGSQPYCTFVIRPKVEKFEKVFKTKLKTTSQP